MGWLMGWKVTPLKSLTTPTYQALCYYFGTYNWHIRPTKLKAHRHEQQRQQIPTAKRKNLLG